MTKPHFKPEFRQEIAELVVGKGYSIREAAEAMGVGKSTVDKWARDLRKERNGEETQGAPSAVESGIWDAKISSSKWKKKY